MAEKTQVVCDVHGRDHPATHFAVPVDMCDAAFAKHEGRIAGVQRKGSNRSRELLELDNDYLLERLVEVPGQGRSRYAEMTGWDVNRVGLTLNRLKKQGLVRSKGMAQNAVWNPTARGKAS